MRTSICSALLSVTILFLIQTNSWSQPFSNPLPIPYLIPGSDFDIEIQSAFHNFDPNGTVSKINLNVSLPTYCYNQVGSQGMSYNGPTLIFEKGEHMFFNITNLISDSMNTTVHWHGLNVPAEDDGGPHQIINHNTTWSPDFPIIDPVQTIWYHSHLMNFTTDQVIRGMAGLIIVEDSISDPLYAVLPHTYGLNDIPINIQEKGFLLDSSTVPPTAVAIKAGERPGNGPYTLINGVVNAVQSVPDEIIRLRVLNGSPRKMFHIGLSKHMKKYDDFQTLYFFASGGGYLPKIYPVDSSLMSIGDRREFLVDLTNFEHGDSLYLRNLSIPKDANYGNTLGTALMAWVVDTSIASSAPITQLPMELDVEYDLAAGEIFRSRTKKLLGQGGSKGVWTIDGTPMNLRVINDTVLVNSKEKWIIENTTNQAHPFHIHKVQFQVTRYEGMLGVGDTVGVWTFPNLPEELIGYKDVQLIRAGATLEFEARFDSFPSPLQPDQGFMYHCHILTHEDSSMMHQFVVVDSSHFDLSTSLEGLRADFSFGYYPNPTSGTLSFQGDFDQPGMLTLYTLDGKMVKKMPLRNPLHSVIDITDLPRGMIILEFTSHDHRFIEKLILK